MWKKTLIVIHSAILLICCGDDKRESLDNVFYYNDDIGITSLDPAFAKDQTAIWAVSQIFNGLVQMDDSLRIIPCIAKSWEISDDGLKYTFHLRSDILFSELKPYDILKNTEERILTAQDVVFSFARIVDPGTASPGAWIFNDKIDPVTPLRKGSRVIGYVNGNDPKKATAFSAPDDSTVVIRLNKAFPPFLSMLTMPYCYVVSKKAVERLGHEFRSRPVGSGPFCVAHWEEGVKLVLRKNKDYFEFDGKQRLPYLDAISTSFIPNKQTAFMEFIAGRLDYFTGLDGSYKDELLTKNGQLRSKYQGKFRLETAPYLNTEFIAFLVDSSLPLVQQSPVKLKKFRQAVSCAINRDEMLKYLRNNVGNAAVNGFVPDGLPKGQPSGKMEFNRARAKELLAEAGYPDGKGLPEISLSTVATYMDIAVFIQKQLAECGIKLKIDLRQSSALRDAKSKSELLFFRGSWIADYPDAENYLATFYSRNFSPDGPNYCHFKNERFDKLYEEALRTVDPASREKLIAEMEDILIEEMPAVVLFYDRSTRLIRNNIEGLSANPMNWLVLKKVRKQSM